MNALLLAIVVGQTTSPVMWVVAPKDSDVLAILAVPRETDTDAIVTTREANGAWSVLRTADEQSKFRNDAATLQAQKAFPSARAHIVVDGPRAIQAIVASSTRLDAQRALQKLAVDRIRYLLGGVTMIGKDGAHFDALATYPPPRSGFVEALGPAVDVTVPAWVPREAANIVRLSVRPAGAFNQASMALSAADPMDHALFITHLRGLEQQFGKRFADDALGTEPRVWTVYEREGAVVAVLEVADVTLVKRFLDSYADAVTALAPGTRVVRSKVRNHDALSVTLPSKETFAIAYDSGAIVVATSSAALTSHYASKGRGKPASSSSKAIAFGSAVYAKNTATFAVTLADDGFHLVADTKAKK